MPDFAVDKFYFYSGPNYYLDRKAMVFNLSIDPEGKRVDFYAPHVTKEFPQMADDLPSSVVDLFADVLVQVLKMDIDLYINRYSINRDGDDFVIAVEYLDKISAEDSVYLVRDWFRAINEGDDFDFRAEFIKLQEDFDRTLYGGPTIYSLIEAGLKRDIPVNYLFEENQFQWGYGKKQLRGRSTTFHKDSIKDTEFTMYKDIVKDFLLMFGFPTPTGKNCMDKQAAVKQAEALGYPVVVKPLAGHKGQGVTTGVANAEQVEAAFQNIVDAAEAAGAAFEGAIVEKEIYGTDHRLLTVGAKFAAGLERVPAYVEGDGKNTIEELIAVENDKEVRLDNARSPLAKIKIDDDLKDYLSLQNLTIDSVPKEGERIYLRRVANISAGGVSINVTDKVHPKNVKLVEDIAKFFQVSVLGIDVLAEDISVPWDEGSFGIIEINAGPGVFMHLAPALGGSIDVPGKIMKVHFPQQGNARIPIVSGNKITRELCDQIYADLKQIKPDVEFADVTADGVFFNGEYLCKPEEHDESIKIALRNPRLDFAVFNHTKDDIFDYGTYHRGADVAIVDSPHYAEEILARDIQPDGFVIEVEENTVTVHQGDEERGTYTVGPEANADQIIAEALRPLLKGLLEKYE
jgi:cyanophycin synthetase